MAANSDWSPFLSYWGYYCKDTLKHLRRGDDQGLQYSEGLLNSLCYETDVGSIPRGIKLNSGVTAPRYGNTDNWNRQIQGCYWCVADDTSWNGICCSKECFFYLHDWCIERVELFTKRRFCRFPGCEMGAAKNDRYCDKNHKGKFDAAFPRAADFNSLLRTVIRAGPDWYSHSRTSQIAQFSRKAGSQNYTSKTHDEILYKTNSPLLIPNTKTTTALYGNKAIIRKPYAMDFPIELRNAMIFKTDIGVIPRHGIEEEHLSSPFSSSPNWLREIHGCIRCANKSVTTTGDANFCTYRCYLLFYEWCRRLVETLTGVRLCRNTGCDKLAAEGFVCCSREHTKALEEKYNQVKSGDFERLIALVPNWYRKCDFPKDIIESHKQIQSPPAPLKLPLAAPINPLSHSLALNTGISSQIESRGFLRTITDYENPYTLMSTKEHSTFLHSDPGSSQSDLSNEGTSSDESNDNTFYGQKSNISVSRPSRQIPTFSNKLITLAGAQVRNKIETPRQEVEATTSVLTDHMYTAPNTNTRIDLRLQRSQSLIEQNPHQSSGLVLPDIYPFSLATKLTDMLSQYTDVGVIPRHRAPHTPAPREHAAQSNWGARIVGCYWCELNNTSFHELTCSRRCWLLFHEWSVRKIETGCGTRMCALPGCENSRADGCVCCSLGHIRDLSELRGSASLSMEEEVEIILGPKWYSDLSPINFSRTGAFYEFSNYFPSLLILEDSIWPTVYHYLCARKLVGTPYSNHISRMECVGELEMWMKRRTCGKWVRADWSRVWEGATYRAVFAKFQQNSVLRGLLLRTGRRPLVCRDSSLGDVLVGLRERFKTQRFFPTGQLEALINPACKSINNPTIVSKTSLVHSPSQDRESLPTEKSDKNNSEFLNVIPKDKELVSASGYDPVSD